MDEEPKDPILALWDKIKPYWHVLTFIIIFFTIVATKWSKLDDHDSRIVALEIWRMEVSKDMATMKQEVHDIHETIIPQR